MTFIQVGFVPYQTKKQLSESFGISTRTVSRRIAEMKGFVPSRYHRTAIIEDGGKTVVSYLAFADYLATRAFLLDSHLRKVAPPFEPERIRELSGIAEQER